MKIGLFLVFLSLSALASPLTQMNQRVRVYNEVRDMTCLDDSPSPVDQGIYIDVSCSLKCQGRENQIERVRGPFIPSRLGLSPGNGSNETMVLWGGLNLSLKMWSDGLCLEKARIACKSELLIDSFEVSELQSGGWKVKRMPGCQEKEVTISPFYDEVKPDRVPALAGLIELRGSSEKALSSSAYELKLGNEQIKLAYATSLKNPGECKRVITASICYGDCVDLNVSDIVETIATSDPLGRETVQVCGDALFAKLAPFKLSTSMKKHVCENYFWTSLLSEDNLAFKTCAATRGDVDCQSLLD